MDKDSFGLILAIIGLLIIIGVIIIGAFAFSAWLGFVILGMFLIILGISLSEC